MRRSFIYLRRGLVGVSCAIVFGFGATQAFGGPKQGPVTYCPDMGIDRPYHSCGSFCPGRQGYCAAGGVCVCGEIPESW